MFSFKTRPWWLNDGPAQKFKCNYSAAAGVTAESEDGQCGIVVLSA